MVCEDGSEGVRLDWFVKMFQVHEEESAVHYQGNIGRKSGRASSTASLPTSRESAASVSELYLQSPMHDSCLQITWGQGALTRRAAVLQARCMQLEWHSKQEPQPAHGGTFKPRSCRARYSLRSGAVCHCSPWNGFAHEILPGTVVIVLPHRQMRGATVHLRGQNEEWMFSICLPRDGFSHKVLPDAIVIVLPRRQVRRLPLRAPLRAEQLAVVRHVVQHRHRLS